MARSRSQSAPRLTRDASRLITLAQALNRSGSRVEDIFWEAQLAEAIPKLLKAGQDAPLEAALDHLAQADVGAYEVLIEQAETLSESTKIDKNGVRHDVLLVVAPVVAWTRYAIPTGAISASAQQAVLAQLHGHVLSSQARAALMPWLVSVDQMPRTFSETWQWLQRLGTQALGAETMKPALNTEAETANMLADTRYIVAAVAVPEHAPIFRWQEQIGDADASREACQQQWAAQAQPTLAALLPGCGFESLLPDAYYVSNREADRRVRPLSLRAAISWLEGAVNLEASQLRAVVAGCGESRIDEYRIGFTARNSNDVLRLRLAAVRARGRPAGRRRPAGRGRRNRRAAQGIRRQRRAPHSRPAARLLRGLRRALLPESAGRTGARRAARGRRGRAGQVPLGSAMRADIFCRVVDNYGDIGVCWRLARRLAQVPGWRPRLWVDDLRAFARIQPGWTRNRRASNAWASTSSTGRRRRPPT